jgi:hypothetical protein
VAAHAAKPATVATVNRLQSGVVGHDDPPHSDHSRQVQATFVLRLRAEPGRDPLRACGLRAISIKECRDPDPVEGAQ